MDGEREGERRLTTGIDLRNAIGGGSIWSEGRAGGRAGGGAANKKQTTTTLQKMNNELPNETTRKFLRRKKYLTCFGRW